MSVCLDLDGIELHFQIDEYKPSENEMWDQEWCNCELRLISGDWLNLKRSGELFLNSEVEGMLQHMIELLRDKEMGKPREVEFIEPDFRMVLHPIKDLRKEYAYCKPGYEFQDVFIEWKTYIWNGGLTDNYMTVVLYREDIQKMIQYLSSVIAREQKAKE